MHSAVSDIESVTQVPVPLDVTESLLCMV